MSRVGKNPIESPSGVTVSVSGQDVTVKGPKGTLSMRAPREVKLSQNGGALTVSPVDDSQRARAMWGTTRALIANQVRGVSQGFERTLELQGVGYRAQMKGKSLQLQLGLSHDVVYDPPEGVSIATPKPTEIVISGVDKQAVGQTAAEIRKFRPPEPYKGKGVRIAGEYVRRKEGKKK